MDHDKRAALEATGFRVTTVADFLGLSEEENDLVELRVALSQEIRRLRESQNLSQRDVALKMKTSQPRIAKIEAAAPGVSFELMLRELHVLGGRVARLEFAQTLHPIHPGADVAKAAPRKSAGKGSGIFRNVYASPELAPSKAAKKRKSAKIAK